MVKQMHLMNHKFVSSYRACSIFLLSFASLLFFGAMGHAEDTSKEVSTSIHAEVEKSELNTTPLKFKSNLDVLEIGRNYQDQYLKSVSSLTVITPHIDVIYSSWLSFDAEISGVFIAGNTKNFLNDEGRTANLVLLDEAAINFKPIKELEFRGGALSTKINPILSIMSDNTFFGTTQKFALENVTSSMKASLTLNEAVPSSGTVTHGLIDDAPNAYFVTETLAAEWAISAVSTKINVASTHFEFGNLSSNVASDSVLIGNSPESFDGRGVNAHYIIGFAGFETAASIKTEWTPKISTEIVGSTIINQQGPSDRNNGFQAFMNVKRKFRSFNLIPSYGVFDIAADVTPATYTNMSNRYQNRKGYTVELDVQLEKQKIVFFSSYTRANVLQSNIYSADRDMFNLGLEAKYDFL
jgi:hypothetical protein